MAYIDIAYYGGYIMILLMFWAILRFIANSLLNLIKNYGDSTNTVVPFSNGVAYPVSYWSERGGRPYQEDRHQQLKGKGTDDSSLYGVFDGHGGAKASQFCKDFLLQTVVKDPEFPNDVSKALSRTFFKIDADFSAKARIQMLTDGTTATVAAIHDRTIYVANAGDSRAIIIRKGGKVKVMSIDHRPDRKDEELRIRKLGGKVIHWGRWRVEGILAVSRAIGDVNLQPFVTCEPEILTKKLDSEDEYLVLASDGVFDVMSNEDVAEIVLSSAKDFLEAGKAVCNEAIIMGSTDNVTTLVIDLKQKYMTPVKTSAKAKAKKAK